MASFIYFHPFSSCQRLFSVWGVLFKKAPSSLCMCYLFIWLFVCLFVPIKPWATHKIREAPERDSTSQHVGTFIRDLSLAVPPNQVAHANPRSNIRKVSSPIQAVTKMTPSPVLRRAWWPDQSSLWIHQWPLAKIFHCYQTINGRKSFFFVLTIQLIMVLFYYDYYYLTKCDPKLLLWRRTVSKYQKMTQPCFATVKKQNKKMSLLPHTKSKMCPFIWKQIWKNKLTSK